MNIENEVDEAKNDPFKELAPIGDTPVAPAVGIAAIALNMAMKYHDMNTVHDGALYQQYKLEGRNFRTNSLADVFETAKLIEIHLLGAAPRIAEIVVDAIAHGVENDSTTESESEAEGEPSAESEGDE